MIIIISINKPLPPLHLLRIQFERVLSLWNSFFFKRFFLAASVLKNNLKYEYLAFRVQMRKNIEYELEEARREAENDYQPVYGYVQHLSVVLLMLLVYRNTVIRMHLEKKRV